MRTGHWAGTVQSVTGQLLDGECRAGYLGVDCGVGYWAGTVQLGYQEGSVGLVTRRGV